MNFVCDSSTLIALAETGTLDALAFLKQKAGARFFVPPAVVFETIQRPEEIAQYAFSAFKIERALQEGVLERTPSKRAPPKTGQVLEHANNVFSVNGRPLKILHAGEAEALAAYDEMQARAILVDEKTTRLFIEDSALLRQSLEREYRGKVKVNADASERLQKLLKGMNCVRSTEVLAIAFEKGFFQAYAKNEEKAFHAALFAVKKAGCSITTHELLEYQEVKKATVETTSGKAANENWLAPVREANAPKP
ncbi:hypothetical protein HYV43_02100 [Candidatus Micrarchaeota archaeon]|nr:hypothetical protein [Candidatus Micrarchaeota archaeon]